MTWGELAAAIAKPEFTQAKHDTEIYAKGDYYLEV